MPKSKTYSIGYLTKKIWANKIYSDDFDIDKAAEETQNKRLFPSIAANQAIMEDIEYSELENPYFSDNSSASQLSTKLRAFSRELAKVQDKSDNDSSRVSRHSVSGQVNKGAKITNYH